MMSRSYGNIHQTEIREVGRRNEWSLIIDIAVDINKNIHTLTVKESSIISLGGNKKSILKYWW